MINPFSEKNIYWHKIFQPFVDAINELFCSDKTKGDNKTIVINNNIVSSDLFNYDTTLNQITLKDKVKNVNFNGEVVYRFLSREDANNLVYLDIHSDDGERLIDLIASATDNYTEFYVAPNSIYGFTGYKNTSAHNVSFVFNCEDESGISVRNQSYIDTLTFAAGNGDIKLKSINTGTNSFTSEVQISDKITLKTGNGANQVNIVVDNANEKIDFIVKDKTLTLNANAIDKLNALITNADALIQSSFA